MKRLSLYSSRQVWENINGKRKHYSASCVATEKAKLSWYSNPMQQHLHKFCDLPVVKNRDVRPALYLSIWNSPKAKWTPSDLLRGAPASLLMPNFGWPGRPAYPLSDCPSDLPSLPEGCLHSFTWHLPRSTTSRHLSFPFNRFPN